MDVVLVHAIAVDVVFCASMVTSFLSLVLFGLHFNDRDTFALAKFFICAPMFAAFASARAFTLAVFLKVILFSPVPRASWRYLHLYAIDRRLWAAPKSFWAGSSC